MIASTDVDDCDAYLESTQGPSSISYSKPFECLPEEHLSSKVSFLLSLGVQKFNSVQNV